MVCRGRRRPDEDELERIRRAVRARVLSRLRPEVPRFLLVALSDGARDCAVDVIETGTRGLAPAICKAECASDAPVCGDDVWLALVGLDTDEDGAIAWIAGTADQRLPITLYAYSAACDDRAVGRAYDAGARAVLDPAQLVEGMRGALDEIRTYRRRLATALVYAQMRAWLICEYDADVARELGYTAREEPPIRPLRAVIAHAIRGARIRTGSDVAAAEALGLARQTYQSMTARYNVTAPAPARASALVPVPAAHRAAVIVLP